MKEKYIFLLNDLSLYYSSEEVFISTAFSFISAVRLIK